MATARDAIEWMEARAVENANALFRGQNRVYPSIAPSLARLDAETRVQMWNVCQRFHSAAQGVTGYSVPNEHDRLAILQHYVGYSPVIDLTGTPAVALYFALLGARPGDECVVYSIDRTACGPDVVVSDHAFLMLKPQSGGFRHRWLRQDGYSIGPRRWRDLDAIRSFDLLKLPSVECMRFTKGPEDNTLVSHLGDLEEVSSDPLAAATRGTIVGIARSLGMMTPGIQRLLEASKTIDVEAELVVELEGLLTRAREVHAPTTVIAEIEGLRAGLRQGYWDTSFDASLQWVRQQLRK